MKKMIRVGNAQAFWGDRPSAAADLLSLMPDLDFLTMDYLAEVSMSILALQRQRDAEKGYAQDFVEVVRQLADYWASGGKCRLIANAGGLNPMACAIACQRVLEERGCRSMKIGVVLGDDVISILRNQENGAIEEFRNLDRFQPVSIIQDRLITANAYLGCQGIVEALESHADLVITGRVADPSMVVAAAVHAFGWTLDDWDRLAGATVAGHLLECGTHATGGICTDWLEIDDPTHIGFPIAEIMPDGSCILTKPPNTGGIVSEATIKEQLVYEIGDPSRYISPDVLVSFLGLRLTNQGDHRVAIFGARGSPSPRQLKVSATYRDGYRSAGTLTLFGPQAARKGKKCGAMVLQRLEDAGWRFRDSLVECLGAGDSVPVLPSELKASDSYETVLRIAVEADEKAACEAFSKEMIPLVTAGPQGTTGYAEGRPGVHAIFRYWPCLIDRKLVPHVLKFLKTEDTARDRSAPASWPSISHRSVVNSFAHLHSEEATPAPMAPNKKNVERMRLIDIAFGRSGDKGTGANIGILARSARNYPALVQWLTAERVAEYFQPMGVQSVDRYELPNLLGLNFVLKGILNRAIRNDAQGKALAQALLAIPIDESLFPPH
jgi:hypothetical protein